MNALWLRLLACAVAYVPLIEPAAAVTRAQVIARAEEYRTMEWVGRKKNIFHGRDPAGIRVDTPEIGFSAPGTRPGWWVPGEVNRGMPYKWGGFCTPDSFRAAIKKGRYAGDVYTEQKRRLGDAAVSKRAAGIDCSGFVSRCWRLRRPYSTRELASLCEPLDSFQDLRAGDVLNTYNNHVLIFRSFTDESGERILAYEAGSIPEWKVVLNSIPVSLLKAEGYKPLRYRKIRD